jgi:hypothetical protein
VARTCRVSNRNRACALRRPLASDRRRTAGGLSSAAADDHAMASAYNACLNSTGPYGAPGHGELSCNFLTAPQKASKGAAG